MMSGHDSQRSSPLPDKWGECRTSYGSPTMKIGKQRYSRPPTNVKRFVRACTRRMWEFRDARGNAMVIAKSRLSSKASSPKMAFNCSIVLVLLEDTRWSILSIMELILPVQSEGPNFWIGSYLQYARLYQRSMMEEDARLPLRIGQHSLDDTTACNASV